MTIQLAYILPEHTKPGYIFVLHWESAEALRDILSLSPQLDAISVTGNWNTQG